MGGGGVIGKNQAMKVKICGLKSPDGLSQAAMLGADYVGLIFYEKSKRYAEDPDLKKWLVGNAEVLGDAAKVGVFVNAEVDYVLNTVHDYELDYVQLHGNESAGYCSELKLLWSVNTLKGAKIIKAFSITPDFDFRETAPYASSAALFVFDTGGQSEHGGTGKQWDWDLLNSYRGPTPFLLSGGIGPEDALRISRLKHPQFAGIDINSRFETAPGEKDFDLIASFLERLRQ